MSEKILSIIVPSYNMEKYLPKCLGSLVVAPELMDYVEVLVVNDGSKDRTSEIAHGFADKHPNVFRVIDKSNGNYGSCVNVGLKVAVGVYVKILDADDSFDKSGFPLFLQKLRKITDDERSVDVVVSDFVRADEHGNEIARVESSLPAEAILEISSLDRLDQLYMHGIAYRTQMLRDMGYCQTEGISYTDDEWACYPFLVAKTICYEPVLVYRYLVGRVGQTMDVSVRQRNLWMLLKICKRMVETHRSMSKDLPRANEKYVKNFIISCLSWLYSTAIVELPSKCLDRQLQEFDEWFLNKDPFLRDWLFDVHLISRSLRFSWARAWSNSYSSMILKLQVYRFLLSVGRKIKRLA